MEKKMGGKPPTSQTAILKLLANSKKPLSRKEMENKLPELTKEQIRKTTNRLMYQGRLIMEETKEGVKLFSEPGDTPTEDKTARILKGVEPPPPTTPELDRQAAYLRGYNDGIIEANRDGFNAGRRSAFKSIAKFLNINIDHLI